MRRRTSTKPNVPGWGALAIGLPAEGRLNKEKMIETYFQIKCNGFGRRVAGENRLAPGVLAEESAETRRREETASQDDQSLMRVQHRKAREEKKGGGGDICTRGRRCGEMVGKPSKSLSPGM